MNITVNANSIFDTLMPMYDDIEERYKKIPRGVYIDNNSEYRRLYDEAHKAEQAFYFASDLLSVSINALYKATLAARRWYQRTEWQKCLPEEDAQRLLSCMIRQNESDKKYQKNGGNEYMLFMNKIISDWAKKSREKKQAS